MTDGSSGFVEGAEGADSGGFGEAEDPLIGAVLSNSYRVVRAIGEGGMGRVYEAQHTRIESKRFAVKTLHPEYARHTEVLARFGREVEAAAAIDEPHVVDVYDFGTTPDGRPYMVSELLEGCELAELLEQAGRLEVPLAIGIARQICQALAAAHELGVVHRDVKPENVFLTGDLDSPHVKVLDFGISRLEGKGARTLTKTGMVIGTPSYMAPEQARGDRIDSRADIYAVGAILYRAVTGRLPFERPDVTAMLAAVLTQDPEPPRAIVPDLPPALELVIQRAMAKDPDERFATMADLEVALVRIDREVDLPGRATVRQPLPPPAAPTIEGMDEASSARPELVLLLSAGGVGAVTALMAVASGALRSWRNGAPLTGTEALVISLLLLAATATPVALAVRRIQRDVWPNTARVVELARRLRWPIALALAATGTAALLVRACQAMLMRGPESLSWPGWDLLLGGVALATGVGCAWLGNRRTLPRLSRHAALTAAAAAIVASVAVTTGMSAPNDAAAVGEASSQPNDSAGKPSSDAGETRPANSGAKPSPLSSEQALARWEELRTRLARRQTKEAVAALEALLAVDPDAAANGEVATAIADLSVTAYMLPDTRTRMRELLSSGLGGAGVDILFDIFVTKGGTEVWRDAGRLLADPALREKASADVRVAYDLRMAKCADKSTHFDRAAREGARRTLTELQLLKACRRGGCCLRNDKALEATLEAVLARR